MGKIEELYNILEQLKTTENEEEIEEIKKYIEFGDTRKSIKNIRKINHKK